MVERPNGPKPYSQMVSHSDATTTRASSCSSVKLVTSAILPSQPSQPWPDGVLRHRCRRQDCRLSFSPSSPTEDRTHYTASLGHSVLSAIPETPASLKKKRLAVRKLEMHE